MKRKMKSLVAAFAATTILLGAMPSMAWADTTTYTGFTGTESTKTEFNKYLVMDSDANIPAATFKYSFTYPSEVVYAEGNSTDLSVYPGNWSSVTGTPTIAPVTFAAAAATGDNTTAGLPSDDGTATVGYKYATATATVSFKDVKFTEPGIYRFYITEDDTSGNDGKTDVRNDGITDDQTYNTTTKKFVNRGTDDDGGWGVRTLDVYVYNTSGDSDLKVEDYVLYNGRLTGKPKATTTNENTTKLVDNGAEVEANAKSDGYINVYDTANLSFGKKVDGNQGSKDKFFKFEVEITGVTAGTVISVSSVDGETKLAKPNGTGTDKVNPATIYTNKDVKDANSVTSASATGESGAEKAAFTFYLQQGDYVTLTGLPKGAKYSIKETPEDYTLTTVYGDFKDITNDGTTTTGLSNLKTYLNQAGSTVTSGHADTATATSNTVSETSGIAPSGSSTTMDDIEYAFLNTRAGVIPTGIIMSVAPAVGLVLAGLAAAFAVVLGGKRRKEELEEE